MLATRSPVDIVQILMNGSDLLVMQLRLECKGLDAEGDVVRIDGDEPDDIAPAQVVRLEDRCLYLLSAELPRSVRSSIRAVPPENALADPDVVLPLSSASKWRSAKSFVFRREVSPDEYPDVRRSSSSDSPSLEAFSERSFADIVKRRPVFAAVVDGRIVSCCASSRENDDAAEAWVYTDPSVRGRGYAKQTVAAWAAHAAQQGKTAFYSRDDANQASACVARSLDLHEWSSYVSFE